MSAPKHTAEPWHISGIHPRNIHIGSMDSPMVLASMNDIHTQTPENAARIVACVNACAGMDDPAAEIASLMRHMGMRSPTEAVIREANRMREQRDSLAAALRDVLPYAEAAIGPTHRANPPADSVITAARAALAKLDGGS